MATPAAAAGGVAEEENDGFGRAASVAPSYAPPGALVVDGAIVDAECSAPGNVVLSGLPGSAYTTVRTHARRSLVVQWDVHAGRLHASARALDAEAGKGLGWPEDFGAAASPSVALALQTLGARASADDGSGEAMVVVAVTPRAHREAAADTAAGGGWSVTALALALPMPFRHNGKVDLLAAGEPTIPLGWSMWPTWCDAQVLERPLAAAKVSDWVNERRQVEAQRPETCGETVLCDAQGRAGEGCLTNFFVVHADRSVQTAPADGTVLDGTMRQLVLQACKDLGLEVREERPDPVAAAMGATSTERPIVHWVEAFLTSAGRVVQPVQGVILQRDMFPTLPGGGRVEFNSITPVSDAIRTRVYELVAASASPLTA